MWASSRSPVATAIGAHLWEHEEVGSSLWASGPGPDQTQSGALPQPPACGPEDPLVRPQLQLPLAQLSSGP